MKFNSIQLIYANLKLKAVSQNVRNTVSIFFISWIIKFLMNSLVCLYFKYVYVSNWSELGDLLQTECFNLTEVRPAQHLN